MDGTFKLCPEIFYQIYTIHALNNDQVFPSAFALLPNKMKKHTTDFQSSQECFYETGEGAY